MVLAEIISIGNELLNGRTINSNASYIGQRLTDIGVHVNWITTVGDDPKQVLNSLQLAVSRAQIVITTGGLGPTHDDITRDVVSDFFNTELVLNQDVLDSIIRRFEKRGVKMAKINEKQALVPKTAEVIANTVGTAPGFILREPTTTIFVLPGVPVESEMMIDNSVLNYIKTNYKLSFIRSQLFRTIGIPESTLFERLTDLEEIEKFVQVSFLPTKGSVDIKITAEADNEELCLQKLHKGESLVRPHVEDYVYATGETPLEEIIANLLIQNNFTLAVAESCTGGLIAHKLTNISGSSKYFERGVVSYSNKAKMDILGVPAKTIEEYGAVSQQTAIAMAEGIRKISNTHFGLSTTGIAGPTGGSKDKPVGLVYIGFSAHEKSSFIKHIFVTDRITNKERFAQAALNFFRKEIVQITSIQ